MHSIVGIIFFLNVMYCPISCIYVYLFPKTITVGIFFIKFSEYILPCHSEKKFFSNQLQFSEMSKSILDSTFSYCHFQADRYRVLWF